MPTAVPVASPATLAALELASLLALVAEFAATDLGRGAVLSLAPHGERAALDRERAGYAEAAQLEVAGGALLPVVGAAPGAALAALGAADAPLGGAQILALAEMVRGAQHAKARILAAEPPCPILAAAAAELPDLQPLVTRVERILDRRGEVRDDASPRLAALRRRVVHGREQVYGALATWRERLRDELAEETVPMRGGRLVLMLQAGARGRAAGLHGRSAPQERLLRAARARRAEQRAAAGGRGRGR
jgi:DNA mismatch repair protein MutS2